MKILSRVQVLAVMLCMSGVLPTLPLYAAMDSRARISVIFVEPQKFTDAGYAEGERGVRAILLDLEKFIVQTAERYLPESMRLETKINDIDLAGDFELFRGPQVDRVRVHQGSLSAAYQP